MMRLILAALLLALPSLARAQSSFGFTAGTPLAAAALDAAGATKMDAAFGVATGATLNASTLNSGILNNVSINSGNLLGTLTGGTLSGTTLVNASFVGSTGTPNEIAVTCGTTNTLLLAASSASAFISVKIPAAATGGPVWFNYAGTNAVAATPSIDVPAGDIITFSTAAGFLPTSAVNCISTSAPISVTLIWK